MKGASTSLNTSIRIETFSSLFLHFGFSVFVFMNSYVCAYVPPGGRGYLNNVWAQERMISCWAGRYRAPLRVLNPDSV